MADWNNETDSIVIGKCVNANSDLSGVNGTKQAGEQRQGNQYNNFQNWIGGNVEVKVKAEAPIIAMRAL
jgi:hypothetical protein